MADKTSDEIVEDFRARALEHGEIRIESRIDYRGRHHLDTFALFESQGVTVTLEQALAEIERRRQK